MDEEERRIRDEYLGHPDYHRKLQEYQQRKAAGPCGATCTAACASQEGVRTEGTTSGAAALHSGCPDYYRRAHEQQVREGIAPPPSAAGQDQTASPSEKYGPCLRSGHEEGI